MVYFRTFLVLLFLIINTFWAGITVILIGPLSRKKEIAYAIAKYWCWSLLKVSGVKVEVTGTEHLIPGKPYLFIPNHQSHFDAPSLITSIPHQIRFLAKKSLTYLPIFGWGIMSLGSIIIDRSNHTKAIASMNRAAKMIKEGTSVFVFVEGSRSLDGTIGEFKKGAFVLAIKSGVELVPIRIEGSIHVHRKGSCIIRPGRVRIRVGRPIDPSDYALEDKERLISKARDSISAELTQP